MVCSLWATTKAHLNELSMHPLFKPNISLGPLKRNMCADRDISHITPCEGTHQFLIFYSVRISKVCKYDIFISHPEIVVSY